MHDPLFSGASLCDIHRSRDPVSYQYNTHHKPLPANMESSRTLQQNTIGSGNRNCLNTIYSNNTIHNTTYTDEKRQILEWLSPLEPGIRHRDVSTRRRPGLGNWFFRNEEFIKWRDGKDDSRKTTLFCSGNPGVGKTYLRYEGRATPYE